MSGLCEQDQKLGKSRRSEAAELGNNTEFCSTGRNQVSRRSRLKHKKVKSSIRRRKRIITERSRAGNLLII